MLLWPGSDPAHRDPLWQYYSSTPHSQILERTLMIACSYVCVPAGLSLYVSKMMSQLSASSSSQRAEHNSSHHERFRPPAHLVAQVLGMKARACAHVRKFVDRRVSRPSRRQQQQVDVADRTLKES